MMDGSNSSSKWECEPLSNRCIDCSVYSPHTFKLHRRRKCGLDMTCRLCTGYTALVSSMMLRPLPLVASVDDADQPKDQFVFFFGLSCSGLRPLEPPPMDAAWVFFISPSHRGHLFSQTHEDDAQLVAAHGPGAAGSPSAVCEAST